MAPHDDEAARSDPAGSSSEREEGVPLTMGLERFQELLNEEGLYVAAEAEAEDDDDDSDYQDEDAEDDGDFFGNLTISSQ